METMRVMFTAMADDDMARDRQVATPDCYACDSGRNMTSDQLIDVGEEAREYGMTFYWQVTEPRVHIDGQTAWITYVNRGSIRIGADQREMVWLEYAVLRKNGEAWRIRLLHATVSSREQTSPPHRLPPHPAPAPYSRVFPRRPTYISIWS